jgi:hypothetical protein
MGVLEARAEVGERAARMGHGAEILPQKQNSEIKEQEAGRLEQMG